VAAVVAVVMQSCGVQAGEKYISLRLCDHQSIIRLKHLGAHRRARSTETAAAATQDRVVNVTKVQHTVHLKELRQTPDTIRGTNGMNTRVRADAALYL
jgi:hypothetical protein